MGKLASILLLVLTMEVSSSAFAGATQEKPSSLDFRVSNGAFLKLKLGSSRADVEKAGAKVFEIDRETRFSGNVFSVAFLPEEPEGTFKRTVYFHKDFGLYRARWEIGNPSRDNTFTPEELFAKWKELLTSFQNANPKAQLTKFSYPDVNDLDLNALRNVQKGPKTFEALSLESLTKNMIVFSQKN